MARDLHLHVPVLEGVRPVDRSRIGPEVLAGVTLAALAIPETMGYATIAGMPVITGLYTLVIPLLLYILLGSSRHLVVGADSASAAVMAAAMVGMASTGSSEYVEIAGMLALTVAAVLLLFRLARLGFLADFLSRTVLVGFLTGVGIQVAMGQVGGMLGITLTDPPSGTIPKFVDTLQNLDETSLATLGMSVAVIVVVKGFRFITKVIPGALIAVIGSIFAEWFWDLSDHGISNVGPVQSGLPGIGLPTGVTWSEFTTLIPTAVSIAILILAQSAATSRAYAAKYNDRFTENTDLVGLTAANIGAGVTGTFVVNGSPTKTEMVDGAGGKSQLAGLVASGVVIVVLLFLTGAVEYLPNATLAAIVFLIGIELVDISGLRQIAKVRTSEFVVALIVAATVVIVGVEQAIFLAIALSIVDHIRRSYQPNNAVISEQGGQLEATAVEPEARTLPGLVVYRFNADLYYANSNHLFEEVNGFLSRAGDEPVRWLCIDAAAMFDVDYTAAQTLRQVIEVCRSHDVRLVVCHLLPDVRDELDRYGLLDEAGRDAIYPTVHAVLEAYRAVGSARNLGDDA